MPRPKGSGAIKPINPGKHDFPTIRQMLYTGEDAPVRGKLEKLLIHWRNLTAQRDDCAQRLKAGSADERTSKRLAQLNDEIAEKWQALGAELEKLDAQGFSDAFESLAQAARPPVFAWQEAATRIVEVYVLLDRSAEDKTEAASNPAPSTVAKETTKATRGFVTKERLRAAARHTERLDTLDRYLKSSKGRAEKERLDTLDRYLKSSKGGAEQRSEQAKAAAAKQAQQKRESDKARSPEGRMLNMTFSEFDEQMRTQGFNVQERQLRRFLSDILKVHLISEQGKRG